MGGSLYMTAVIVRYNWKGRENDDTVRRSIIRSIVRQERKLDRRPRSEHLDLQLSPERLRLRSH